MGQVERKGPWVVAAVSVMALGLLYASIEVVQRRKAAVLVAEVSAALRDFQAKAGPGRFVVTEESSSELYGSIHGWVVMPAGKPVSPRPPEWFNVEITQERKWFLRPPEILVFWALGEDHNVQTLLNAALSARGLSFETGIAAE